MPHYISTQICSEFKLSSILCVSKKLSPLLSAVTTIMEYSALSNWLLLMLIAVLMFRSTKAGGCIEEERRALLKIKSSLINSYDLEAEDPLLTWIDYGGGRECCDWERVKCNTTTGHVTQISFYNLTYFSHQPWPLNVSLFLHFEELTSLNLSRNYLDGGILKAELKKLSSLKKLEILDLSFNFHIENDILPSLGVLISLKFLDLSYTSLDGYFPTNEFAALENLESLDFTGCGFYGFESSFKLKKLEIFKIGFNQFNDSLITSLSDLPSLKALYLSGNPLLRSFPAQELSHLTNIEKLDLSYTGLNGTPDIKACKSLSRLKRLETISLSDNYFNKSTISCLSDLPFLKILDLASCSSLGGSFPVQEFRNLTDLRVLLLSNIGFNGTLPMEAFGSFHQLEVLDMASNGFVGSVSSAIQALSSLRVVSFADNKLSGSLPNHGFCDLKNLYELDLSHNMFDGILPKCFKSLSSLKVLDISSNQFTGRLQPSLIANLTSLEYIDCSHNHFEGSFSFSSFSNHTKLQVVAFTSNNDKFEVETEEPADWIPMFQLKVLVLSNCNINRAKGRVVPGFLLHQQKLRVVDLSHNSLYGQFPNWLFNNNRHLELLNLRNNSLGGSIYMPLYRINAEMLYLDISRNRIIGSIPDNIQKFSPYIDHLNLSNNALSGSIPSSIGDLGTLRHLDLSDNELSGEVPKGLFAGNLEILKLSKNLLHGKVLSGNLSLGNIHMVHLDSNGFSGTISNETIENTYVKVLDISNNFFTGMIPDWMTNTIPMGYFTQLVVRNNSLEGRFPCGATMYSFLDISQNSFSGPIPSCSNFKYIEHLHLGSNKFTGSIPNFLQNLNRLLTLDLGDNNLSGRIPVFLGRLSDLRILVLRKNNFNGSIPKQLCQLRNVSLMDLSDNSLSGSIPKCLQNMTGSSYLAFEKKKTSTDHPYPNYAYWSDVGTGQAIDITNEVFEIQDEIEFTTKSLSLPYKGGVLDILSGLDLSSNKLTGNIPKELGLLTKIHTLNLSHNQLTGPIPVSFSNLENIESLDLSSNSLTGKVPSELTELTYLGVFNVSHNNLSGRLPDMKAQFGTFTESSYEGNPLLCGLPLKKKCTTTFQVANRSVEEDNEKWYNIDMTCFYASSSSTCVVFFLGFVALIYVNPYWCRRWLDLVEDCIFACYYFLYDLVRKPSLP